MYSVPLPSEQEKSVHGKQAMGDRKKTCSKPPKKKTLAQWPIYHKIQDVCGMFTPTQTADRLCKTSLTISSAIGKSH
jgi:hypothetical protein